MSTSNNDLILIDLGMSAKYYNVDLILMEENNRLFPAISGTVAWRLEQPQWRTVFACSPNREMHI